VPLLQKLKDKHLEPKQATQLRDGFWRRGTLPSPHTYLTTSVPSMPAAAWPGTVQRKV